MTGYPILQPPATRSTVKAPPWLGTVALGSSILGFVCVVGPPLVLMVLPVLLGGAWWMAGDSPVPFLAIIAFTGSFLFLLLGLVLGIVATAIKAGRKAGIAAIVVAAIPAVLGIVMFVMSMLGAIVLMQSFPR